MTIFEHWVNYGAPWRNRTSYRPSFVKERFRRALKGQGAYIGIYTTMKIVDLSSLVDMTSIHQKLRRVLPFTRVLALYLFVFFYRTRLV